MKKLLLKNNNRKTDNKMSTDECFASSHAITLIALVITIIILLILVGICINLLLGDNGIITKSKIAREKTEQAAKEEKEGLDYLDKYIQDNIDGYETVEIDKSHDGIQYDPVTTDDGMWTVYKDIDTETRKVNVYVTSKYYCPSFGQYVLEKYYLNTMLHSYALPIYSFSDLSDFGAMITIMTWGEEGMTNELIKKSDNYIYIRDRIEQMGVGPFLSELLETVGVNEYDLYKLVGEDLAEKLEKKEELFINYYPLVDSSADNFDIVEYVSGTTIYDPCLCEDSAKSRGPELNLENLLNSYNKLYGDKAKLSIPEEEKNKIYKIEMPNGKVEEIKGEDLYKAKFRYVTTKNGDIQIKIASNTSETKTINYDKVTNIGSCMYEEGDYLYTYNCMPIFDDATSIGAVAKKYICDEPNEFTYEYNREDNLIYRFNLGRLECYE